MAATDRFAPGKRVNDIYYIAIWRVDKDGSASSDGVATELAVLFDKSGIPFMARSAADLVPFLVKQYVQNSQPDRRLVEDKNNNRLHIYRPGGTNLCASCAVPVGYGNSTAQYILGRAMDDFRAKWGREANSPNPKIDFSKELAGYLEELRANKESSLVAAQRELDETKDILKNTINAVLERGEKLDSLVAKSNDLGMQSKYFYQASKKQNSCCTIM